MAKWAWHLPQEYLGIDIFKVNPKIKKGNLKGAKKGIGDTAYHLAELYAAGLGIPNGLCKAIGWYQVSAK